MPEVYVQGWISDTGTAALSLHAALTVDNPRRSFAGSARALAGVPGELLVHLALHYVRQRKTSLGDK